MRSIFHRSESRHAHVEKRKEHLPIGQALAVIGALSLVAWMVLIVIAFVLYETF